MIKFIIFVLLSLAPGSRASHGFECKTDESELRKAYSNAANMHHITEGGDPVYAWRLDADGSTSKAKEARIRKVMKYYEEKTCIRFKEIGIDLPKDYNGRYLQFHERAGCATGWHGKMIEIGSSGCNNVGLAHEMGHAFGWGHEQSRSDASKNFYFLDRPADDPGSFEDIYGIPYDYFSIMQYPPSANFEGLQWLARKRKYTHAAGCYSNGLNQPMRGKEIMSYNDIRRANYQFRCNQTCSNIKSTWCENQGYLEPAKSPGLLCKCICPYGTSGDRCQDGKPQFYSDLCGGTYDKDTVLKTPGYDQNNRTSNSWCTFIVKGKPGKRIKLFWDDLDIGHAKSGGGCSNGYLDVRTTSYWFGEYYCKGYVPKDATQITSVGTDLAIIINPQWYYGGRGLKAHVKYIDTEAPIGCDVKSTILIDANSDPKVIVAFGNSKTKTCSWHFKTNWPQALLQLKIKSSKMTNKGSKVVVHPDSHLSYTYGSVKLANVTAIGNEMKVELTLGEKDIFIAEVITVRSQKSLFFPKQLTSCNMSQDIGPNKNGAFVSPNYYGLIYKNVGSEYPPNVYCHYRFESKDSGVTAIKINFQQMKTRHNFKLNTFDIKSEDTFEVVHYYHQNTTKITTLGEYTFPGNAIEIRFNSKSHAKGFFGNVWTV